MFFCALAAAARLGCELTLPEVSQSVVLTATVAGTGIVNTNVTWKVAGASELASGTHIDGGTLYVAKDETNTTLTVTATSSQDSTKSGTATITVNA